MGTMKRGEKVRTMMKLVTKGMRTERTILPTKIQ